MGAGKGRPTVAVLTVLLVVVAWILLYPRSAAPRERVIEIRAQQFYYEPGIIEVNRGDRVILKLIALDVAHGLYLDGYELQTSAVPGKESLLQFVADKPGRFMFRCSVTCGSFHPYMVGWLRVKPNVYMNISYLLTGVMATGAIFFIWRSKERTR